MVYSEKYVVSTSKLFTPVHIDKTFSLRVL